MHGGDTAAAGVLASRFLKQAVHSRELLARVDPQLQVDVVQVVFDRRYCSAPASSRRWIHFEVQGIFARSQRLA